MNTEGVANEEEEKKFNISGQRPIINFIFFYFFLIYFNTF